MGTESRRCVPTAGWKAGTKSRRCVLTAGWEGRDKEKKVCKDC